jgi:hypothetical protein
VFGQQVVHPLVADVAECVLVDRELRQFEISGLEGSAGPGGESQREGEGEDE